MRIIRHLRAQFIATLHPHALTPLAYTRRCTNMPGQLGLSLVASGQAFEELAEALPAKGNDA